MMLLNVLKVILTVINVITAILLITAILMQKSKTQGAGLAFGSGVGETLFGGQIGNVMTRVTVVLTVIFLLNTTALTFLAVKSRHGRVIRVNEPAQQAPAEQPLGSMESAPLEPVPGGNGAGQNGQPDSQ